MNTRVLNYVAFVVLIISTVLGFESLWGALFIFWTIRSFYSGHAFLLTDATRDEDPILFWAIQFVWITLGILIVLQDFFPYLLADYS